MHLHAHPHVSGQLGQQCCVLAGLGAEIDLLDTDRRGPIPGMFLFEGFKEGEG
jgi:hypothetical protein